ncbi:DUF3987 domain-containing protein [Paenibacillus albus]|uniref:DUF3987 domain-containing protein n=1 Tax=Paenibacillus albus TaxID=2495582 RepID=A0A3S9A410_9BACL|nr:DUF3987 domain-containing protein [Paenibacillus albus]AZN40450.1 DUF3987 domain-containing protein [Paenibacillus albus]
MSSIPPIKLTEDDILYTAERMPLPITAMPKKLAKFVATVSKALRCPPDYVLAGALASCSIGIGATRKLELRQDWQEQANLFIGIVAPPSTKKTPLMKFTMKPVWSTDEYNERVYQDKLKAYSIQMKEREEALEWNKRNPKKEPKPVAAEEPVAPTETILEVSDITTEALYDIFIENPRGVIGVHDELTSLFDSQGQYKGGKGGDAQFYMSAHSGVLQPRGRKDKRTRRKECFLTLIGNITPDKLTERYKNRPLDGEIDRFLLLYPREPKAEMVQVDDTPVVTPEAKSYYSHLFESMYKMNFEGKDENGKPLAKIIKLNREAAMIFNYYEGNLLSLMQEPDVPAFMRGVYGKLIGYTGRLALILHYIRLYSGEAVQEDTLDAETMNMALHLVQYFKSHAEFVHKAVRVSDDDAVKKKAMLHIRDRGTEGQETISANGSAKGTTMAIKDLYDALNVPKKKVMPVLGELIAEGWGMYVKIPFKDRKRMREGFMLFDQQIEQDTGEVYEEMASARGW